MRQKAFVVILLLAVGFSIGVYLSAARQRQAPDPLLGTVLTQPRALADFRLRDHTGAAFGRAQLQGRWTLLFFGYTSCPDICPTTLSTLRGALSASAESDGLATRVALVTVDPQRDDAAALGQYVAHFGERFIGVLGEESELRAFAQQTGAMFEREPAGEDGRYEVAHSASVFLVDPEGRMHAAFSPPHSPSVIAAKLATIRERYRAIHERS